MEDPSFFVLFFGNNGALILHLHVIAPRVSDHVMTSEPTQKWNM